MSDAACARFEDSVGDYVECTLAPAARARADEHLRACQRCRDLLSSYGRIPALVRRATDVTMPGAARARLRRLLSRAWRSRG